MQHWSLDVQHQIRNNTLVTVGYYGSKGTHLIGMTELNSVAPGRALASNCINAFNQTVRCQTPGYVFRNAGSNTVNVPNNPNANQTNTALQNTDILILDQLRPFRGYRSIAIIQPRYNSNYHSLQVSVRSNDLSGSSQMNLAYTFSKNLTDSQNDRICRSAGYLRHQGGICASRSRSDACSEHQLHLRIAVLQAAE